MLTELTRLTVNTPYVILVECLEGKRAVDKKLDVNGSIMQNVRLGIIAEGK
jgi:hypothetical protein